VDSLWTRLVGNEWVNDWNLLRTTRCKRGVFGGSELTPPVKPQWVRYKLEEAIEKPASDILTHTSKVCNGILLGQWVPDYQG
jgi:hypothetical protein